MQCHLELVFSVPHKKGMEPVFTPCLQQIYLNENGRNALLNVAQGWTTVQGMQRISQLCTGQWIGWDLFNSESFISGIKAPSSI